MFFFPSLLGRYSFREVPHLALVVTPNLIESGVEFLFLAGDGNKVGTFLRTMGLFYKLPNSLVWALT